MYLVFGLKTKSKVEKALCSILEDFWFDWQQCDSVLEVEISGVVHAYGLCVECQLLHLLNTEDFTFQAWQLAGMKSHCWDGILKI